MSKKLFSKPFTISFSLIAAFAALGVLFFAVPFGANAQPPDRSPVAAQTAVGTGFTYQGFLKDAGGPVNATCDFQFSLYDDNLLSPVLLTGPVDKTGVLVSSGYFSTYIDFGADAFTGEGRQMGIAVRCPAGSGSYTTLSGLVGLNAAPYAVSLNPGAVISGSVMAGGALKAVNTYNGIFAGYGVQGVAQDAGVMGVGETAGVKGESSASGGQGVWGVASSGSGAPYGVRGQATDSSATSTGVYGESASANGTGVKGIAPMNGVYGESTVASGSNGWGVYGKTDSSAGYGVYGLAANAAGGYGVYGESSGGYGVYGKATPPDGYGVYSEGNAMVNGTLFWKPVTSAISIPPAAFTPYENGYAFTNDGHSLYIGTTQTPNSQFWLAPVQLPQDATITKFTFYWTNPSGSVQGSAALYRTSLNGNETELAEIATSTSATPTFSSTTTFPAGTTGVDNTAYNYYIYLHLRQESGSVTLHGVTIEYTVYKPY